MSRRLVPLTDAVCPEHPWANTSYLRRLVANRSIPFYKVAGRIWFDVADLDTHQEAGRCDPFSARERGAPSHKGAPGKITNSITMIAASAKKGGRSDGI